MASEMSAAERMAQEHATSHQAYVEPAPEEPEPATAFASASDAPAPSQDASSYAQPTGKKQNKAPLDTQSHELFPELGSSASKGKGAANAIPTWGTSANGKENANGPPRPMVTPAMTLPGRNVESITIEPHHILPKKDLPRPIPDVIREINRKSRANVSMLSAANGRLKFDATGPQDVAQQALKELVRQIGVKVCLCLVGLVAALVSFSLDTLLTDLGRLLSPWRFRSLPAPTSSASRVRPLRASRSEPVLGLICPRNPSQRRR